MFNLLQLDFPSSKSNSPSKNTKQTKTNQTFSFKQCVFFKQISSCTIRKSETVFFVSHCSSWRRCAGLTSAACVSWCNSVSPVRSSRKEWEELNTFDRKLKPSFS